jgi:hypothetical protein
MNNAETYMRDHERHAEARAKLGKVNKASILDALATANITKVLVEFDGEGDSGQIEMIAVVSDGEPAAMPETTVTLQQASWGSDEPAITVIALRNAIETLCYDFLEDEHGGWENNDGAFGEFHLDVTKRTVELEFYARFTDVSTSHHSF